MSEDREENVKCKHEEVRIEIVRYGAYPFQQYQINYCATCGKQL